MHCPSNRRLVDKRADIVYFDLVCMIEVVAEVVLGEVEWDEKARVVRREVRCPHEGNGKLRPGLLSAWLWLNTRRREHTGRPACCQKL